ncbi:hypothetical protein AX17_002551 [Amanita inopinata Kibby_2008]|nr:hypothetical protein AX17_002551 [Amanita inopinata Kibby_2008]
MKFARYLQDTQTPEWKKAYIDYRGLKKRITAIRKAQDGFASNTSHSDVNMPLPLSRPSDIGTVNIALESDSAGRLTPSSQFRTITPFNLDADVPPTPDIQEGYINVPSITTSASPGQGIVTSDISQQTRPKVPKNGRRPSFFQGTPNPRKGRGRSFSLTSFGNGSQWRIRNPLAALPLFELYKHLSPQELQFFTSLDTQLEKIDAFYVKRESEMQARSKALHEQLKELNDHRRLIHRANPAREMSWTSVVKNPIRLKPRRNTLPVVDGVDEKDDIQISEHEQQTWKWIPSTLTSIMLNHQEKDSDTTHGQEHTTKQGIALSTDPDEYLYARKKLKKATLEHYRGLELLQNYRILNVTGFRKALKKFEKVTKIPAQQQYMTERVERSSFASDKALQTMMQEMESLYAQTFVRGNKKTARDRLRGSARVTTHHYSTFRSGLFLGAALPALILGLYQSFQPHIREQIPAWDALLFTYGVFFIFVLFSILISLNLLVWAHFRINYIFIFELDTRTRLDHREYLEDYYMDWSLLRLQSPYPLLRQELVYSDYIPLYYFAIVSNLVIRFIWVIYIPEGGLDFRVRTFIVAVLEMFRRWQWNFLRLENEHLGNVDQYRVTREVPLPYTFDGQYLDGDDDDDERLSRKKSP